MSSTRVGVITFDWFLFEPRARRLGEAAANAGYLVDVICLRQQHEKSYEISNGVHIYRVPMNRGFGRPLPITILSWCWFLLLAGATATWMHLRHHYDVIVVHNMPDFLVFAAVIPKLLGAKVVLDIQDVSPELMAVKAKWHLKKIVVRLAIWQERISTTFADHVITVGWPFEELLLQRGVLQEKITIILNSVDPVLFPAVHNSPSNIESSSEDRPFKLMYHGTVAERHGLDIAIRALALARRVVPQIRLDIKARGEHLPYLKQLTVELGVTGHVVFSEVCPCEEAADFIQHGDVGIIPYQCDGFMELLLPTKVYEFAWMQRPMIASDTRAMRSMFRPQSIILCDPLKPESFADAIIDLYQHPEKRESMIANAAEDYIPYQWEIMAKRYQELLAFLCRKQKQEAGRYPTASSRL